MIPYFSRCCRYHHLQLLHGHRCLNTDDNDVASPDLEGTSSQSSVIALSSLIIVHSTLFVNRIFIDLPNTTLTK